MPLFINADDLFEFSLYFKVINNNVCIIDDKDVDIEDIIVDEKEDIHKSTRRVVCFAKYRDFETFSHILEESSVIRDTDNAVLLREKIYYPMIISTYIKSWNLVNPENNKYYSLDYDKIIRMDYDFISALAHKYLNVVGVE